MWGPYSKTPFSRDYARYDDHEVGMETTYEAAASMASSLTFLAELACTFVAGARVARIRTAKSLRATYVSSSKLIRNIQKILIGTLVYQANLSRISSYYRTLAATVIYSAKVTKRMGQLLKATFGIKASRLRLAKSLGWEYSGDFAPGQRIKVDRDRLTVTLDGSNAMDKVDGEFPYFTAGPNAMIYSDSEADRKIKLRVLWRGRWL